MNCNMQFSQVTGPGRMQYYFNCFLGICAETHLTAAVLRLGQKRGSCHGRQLREETHTPEVGYHITLKAKL